MYGDGMPSISGKERVILELLGRSSEMYGLELVAASGGTLKRGTVYVTLGRMEQKGLISSRLDDETPAGGGLPRRLYMATALGRQVLSTMAAMKRRLMPRLAR